MEIKRSFVKGIMDKSLDDRLLPDGVYRDALNIKVSSLDGDSAGTVHNHLGNTEVLNVNTLLTNEGFTSQSTMTPIGSYVDVKSNNIFWFITTSLYDIIAVYNETDLGVSSGSLLLVETKSGGIMNFNSGYLITGVNLVDDLLFFTDNLNPPRRINIGVTYRDGNISEDTVNVIVRPPIDSPVINLVSDTTNNENNIEDKFIRFAYRYKYKGNEISAISPFSKTAFEAQDFSFDFSTRINKSMRNKANAVEITVDLGGDEVDEVEILMKDSRSSNAVLVGSIKRSQYISQGQTYTYKFSNNKVYTVIPSSQINRLFDNVPLRARSQDLIGRRIVYGNYTQFFDIKRTTGDVVPDFQLLYRSSFQGDGIQSETFKSARDYEVGIAYLDDFGRMTTVLESEKNTTHIPSKQCVNKNDLYVRINSKAPEFASYYRFFLKQNKGTYYNIIPVSIHNDGKFMYFEIAKYDVDKVRTGDYIYVKSTPSGVVPSPEKYKIIEAEIKEKNFLNNANGQDSGFYIKIEADSDIVFDEKDIEYVYNKGRGATGKNVRNPLDKYKKHLDKPIFYGNGFSELQYASSYSGYSAESDQRIIVEVTNAGKFSYRKYDESNWEQEDISMTFGWQNISLNIGGSSKVVARIKFSNTSSYTVGDSWRLNYRGDKKNIFGRDINYNSSVKIDGGFGIVSNVTWTNNNTKWSTSITPGSKIKISIDDNGLQPVQEFFSSNYYENLEEWFFEDKIYSKFNHFVNSNGSQVNIGGKAVFFRRGTGVWKDAFYDTDYIHNTGDQSGSIKMIIKGQESAKNATGLTGTFTREDVDMIVGITIALPQNITILETDGKINDDEVYYELPTTYPILPGGFHGKVLSSDQNQAANVAANITIEDFNAITFGNGLESSTIDDDFNAPNILPSPRANASIDRYEQIVAENSLTYSGVYNESTSTNNLNEFNLSLANFKALDKEYGSIQKLYSRDSDLIVFQENKVSKVLFGKNLLADSIGGGSVVSIPEVLGIQIPYTAEFGISKNPESFAKWGNDIFFTDEKRGAVLNLSQNGINQISSYGMKSWFRDLFDTTAGKQKLGCFDPHDFKYVLSWNEKEVKTCQLSVSQDEIFISGDSFENGSLFVIKSNSDWSINVAQTGSWLTVTPTSGSGDRVISGSVTSNLGNTVDREATITITYCDGLTKNVLLYQSYKEKKQVVVVTTSDKASDKNKGTTPSYDSPSGGYQGGGISMDLGGSYTFERLNPDFVGQNGVPNVGDNVDIIGDTRFYDSFNRPLKPFNPNLGNKMYFAESDVEYDESQGDSLVSASTEVPAIFNVDKYKGTFTYSGNNNFLYLIVDYTNTINFGSSVSSIPTSGNDLPEVINIDSQDSLGRYTVTYSSNATNIRFTIENSNGSIIADSGFISTPSSEVFSVIKATSGNHVIKVYGPDSGYTYDLSISSISLTSFSLSDSGYETESEACGSSGVQTLYHNADGLYPVIGSTIYTDSIGSSVFDGDSLYYKSDNDSIVISTEGIVTSLNSCLCSETSAPVVSQADVYISEGEEVKFTIEATNNPTLYEASGSCREFELFGGISGAVFRGQECKTGLYKDTFVSESETITRCFYIGSVTKVSGDSSSSYTDVGGCLESALPSGLQLDETSGTIYGIPESNGEFDFTVKASNCVGSSSDHTFKIIVSPAVAPNAEFKIDTTSGQADYSAACSIATPTYSTMYHDGILDYPVIRDIIFEDETGYNSFNGNNQWYIMENGVAVQIDTEGFVVDTFLCGINPPTPVTNVQVAFGADSTASCSSSTFNGYYYTGTFGVAPGKLYTDATQTTYAAAGWYKYDLNGSWATFEWSGTDWSGGQADCPL